MGRKEFILAVLAPLLAFFGHKPKPKFVLRGFNHEVVKMMCSYKFYFQTSILKAIPHQLDNPKFRFKTQDVIDG